MNVSDTFGYQIKLQREGFTGQVILNFHKGDLSKSDTIWKSKDFHRGARTTAKKRSLAKVGK